MIELCIASMISFLAAIYLFGKLCKKKLNLKLKHYILIILTSIIQVLLNLYNLKTLSTLLTIIYMFILFRNIYACSKEEARNYSIIIWIISLLLDILLMLIGNAINLMSIYEKYTIQYKLCATMIMSFLIVIIGNIDYLVKNINKLYNKMCKLKINMNHITMIIIAYLFIGFMSNKNMSDNFMITILLVLGISIISIAILFISMRYQIINYKKTNEILEKNDIVNRKIITQYRILKHNLESQLLGVKTVSNKKAQELIDDLIHEYNSSFYIKHDINDMPSGINGLVFEKLYDYHKKEINITITNKIKKNILEEVGPRSYNLFCEALGVTLDNALESSVKSKEKLIYLEFKEASEKLVIKIMNTFSGHIELDKLGTVQYTSKEKGHGFGLFSLIGRKNLSITTSIKNNLFINLIEVKKKVEKTKK